jgi:hypothetical protein
MLSLMLGTDDLMLSTVIEDGAVLYLVALLGAGVWSLVAGVMMISGHCDG